MGQHLKYVSLYIAFLITIITIIFFYFVVPIGSQSLKKHSFIKQYDELLLAEQYYEGGSYQKAIDSYRNIIKSNPDDLRIINRMGECLLQLHRCELALKFFVVLKVKADTKNSKVDVGFALNNIGESYRCLERLDDAINYYNMAIDINLSLQEYPNLSTNYSNLGKIYFNKQEFYKALVHYEKAKTYQEKSQDKLVYGIILNDIAMVYQELDEDKLAEENFVEALKIFNEQKNLAYATVVMVNLSALYIIRDELGLAEKNLEIAE